MSHEAKADAPGRSRISAIASSLLAALTLATLSACSSDGNGGKDVTIGSGQSADPVTLDFPVFYVKQPVPDPEDEEAREDVVREPVRFMKGADLFMRDRASPSAPEVNITGEITQGNGDVRDVDVNFDGTKVIFSMRVIEDPDAEPLPTWNIWEYDTKTQVLRRIITSDTTAEEGHDIQPHYLPDGRIVFSSTRQRQARAILLDENKPQYAAQVEGAGGDPNPAFVLHVMKDDGSDIHQITFNQSHDLNPSVLNDGRIVYAHWEHAIDDDQYDIYAVNPDGTGVELLYGANSHATGTVNPNTGNPSVIQFLNPRAMADGRTLALIRPFKTANQDIDGDGGDLVLIDTATYVDNTRAASPDNASLSGPAQARALPTDVRTIPGPSPGGRYRSAAPLFDGTNRLLVSWSQCRLVEEGRVVPCTSDRLNSTTPRPVEAPPLYGVYIYDVRDNTQKPIVAPQEGFIYTEVVAGSARPLPPVILDQAAGVDFPAELLTENVGILHIRSVYDIDGRDTAPGTIAAVSDPANNAYATRPARFLRIEKVVSQPDEDTRDIRNTAFGPRGRRFGMRDVLGYAPIEPDGSVKVKVPANVPFAISILDARGRRVSGMLGNLHTNWLQVMPGETLECNGCHNPNATPPIAHGRRGLTAAVNKGASGTGTPFPNTNPLLAPFDMGETMAEARGRAMCGGTCEASVDIIGLDFWKPTYDPTAPAEIEMCYQGGPSNVRANPSDTSLTYACAATGALKLSTVMPTTPACRSKWNGLCRITINYETNIHPMWGVDRFVDVDGVEGPDLDPTTMEPINHKCNTCHSPVNPVDGTADVPAADLDLSDGQSPEQADHFLSYEQLLNGRVGQIKDETGAVVPDCLQFETDPETMVMTCVQFRQVPASMSGNGANASNRFFSKFDAGGSHQGYLTSSELKLLSEWLDIGAQYYNDPFAAPEN
ncbi:MAG TPA: hypothetical protein VFR96_18005 [Povalibacter sp.]|nr:hypothetical protein [Povalibacter sp.]